MKKKEKSSLHTMRPDQLAKVIADTKAAIARFTVERYSKQSKNVREVRALKEKLAVAQTIARIKELTHE
jgi:ribosomal protein L29